MKKNIKIYRIACDAERSSSCCVIIHSLIQIQIFLSSLRLFLFLFFMINWNQNFNFFVASELLLLLPMIYLFRSRLSDEFFCCHQPMMDLVLEWWIDNLNKQKLLFFIYSFAINLLHACKHKSLTFEFMQILCEMSQ